MAFFQGTLQEGIAAALQQAKSVVCFVTDGEAESQLWEDDFFAEEEIRSLLPTHAVSLRLVAGSQEEGFLSQLYPIPKRPTVVIIRNGELKEYIAAGVIRDEFVRRLKTSLTAERPAPSQPLPSQPAPPQPQIMAAPAPSATQPSHAEESSASSSGQSTPPSPTGSRMQSLLAERAASLIQQQKKKDQEEAARQHAEKAKAEALASKKTAEQSKHAAALKKQQQEAREERERILKAIEDDKVARKAQQAEAAAARRLSVASEKPDAAQLVVPPPAAAGKFSEHCAIQVRLFDGSTIRHRFSSSETLKDVRKWVNETRGDGKAAYTFKVLLTPLPSKTIDVAEEDKTLQALELAPSSTLILLRVPKFAATYSASARPVAGEAQGSAFQRFVAYVLAIITGFFSTVSAFFSTLFSTAGPPAASEPSTSQTSQSQPAADAARRRGGRIAGMDHMDGRRNDQQFYNGNSTNFEPRSDDGE
ncbi:hypothetical protein C8A01DRAFT_44829 [Parachaetomium inaequale]|uniref:UBX domain-containing protein 2 n=1 Tax=Parachaetomium inaequale TaxID=2588326 RepID=A0AAN6PNP2_9PEZI|nr:hypothetical protein C8A01DRAFT_44829 [Parachaetomium inaequale]